MRSLWSYFSTQVSSGAWFARFIVQKKKKKKAIDTQKKSIFSPVIVASCKTRVLASY